MDSNQKEARLHAYILRQWLVDQKQLLVFHFVFLILFNGVLLLSSSLEKSLSDVFYLDLLYIFFFLGFLIYTHMSYRRLYMPLLRAIEEKRDNLIFFLPETKNPTTRLIHKMAHGIQREHAELEQKLLTTLRETEEYAALWAHEIKNPLAVMFMTLQACEEEALKLDLLEELDRVQHLVEQSLVYNRSTAFAKDYLVTETEPSKLLNELLKKHARSLILKKLTVEKNTCESLIVSDKKWLSFVLEQLLINAIKYSPIGGKIICNFSENEKVLKISICDEGMGIAPEDLPRIFDCGFTGQNGRQFGSSTGMGLFLAKRIAEALGHRIYVQSTLTKGSAFTLWIGKFESNRRDLTKV